MGLRVLFIGGSGQISHCCVEAAMAAGHDVSVFNRGRTASHLPAGVHALAGDFDDDDRYAALGRSRFDVVCQFIAYGAEHVRRDLATFRGNVGQYIFISSASAYQKPVRHCPITERVPLENPFWDYSQRKIAAERVLREQTVVPYTIVRPSHTVRTRFPTLVSEGDQAAARMQAGLSVVVCGDGTSLWTLTRSEDFALPFVGLFGKAAALGEDFHITSDHAFTWDQIYQAIGRSVGAEAGLVHVPSDALVRFEPAWVGPLFGDKMWTALFDNAKVKAVAGDFTCEGDLDRILAAPAAAYRQRLAAGPVARPLDALFDRIIAAQDAVGAPLSPSR
jgi:nucleoside-diphosphate-sugar epimerase